MATRRCWRVFRLLFCQARLGLSVCALDDQRRGREVYVPRLDLSCP